MKLFSEDLVNEVARECNVADLSCSTIGEMVLVAQSLERRTGIPFVRMDQGSPSLPQNRYGIEAEKDALDRGIGSTYPAAEGVPELKKAASDFIKAFVNIDVSPRSCIPVTGSVMGSFSSFIACAQRIPGKDKVLFIDPGFPIMKSQLAIIGVQWRSFDIFHYRGAALRSKLEEELSKGDVAVISYSTPNNPAWICLEDEELEIIGELATEYDAIVLEDQAYFCMDVRRDLSHPYEAPFVPTAARYTDNYILLTSSSKIFSYAGQRIAITCISDALYEKIYPSLASRYHTTGAFGPTLTAAIMYMITSGCTASTQYGYAEMMNLACQGKINFVEDTIAYSRRAERMKRIFLENGFHIVYDKDVTEKIGDGFFFTVGYGDMDGGTLVKELVHYGISLISLSTTGSLQNGVRACSARMTEEMFALLEERAREFGKDHPLH
ncbi:MAG: pyridoxal phosphate-dependent aminotransferase [Bacteroidales bacterium]|nr:pyridoxal phosphate-dependent aminotransferase [Candidatus Cacconaster merdequi]